MTPKNSNLIDLQKLTQRELLIRLHDKVENLEFKVDESNKANSEKFGELYNKQADINTDYIKLESKVKSQSVLFGSLSGFLTGIFAVLIKFFK